MLCMLQLMFTNASYSVLGKRLWLVQVDQCMPWMGCSVFVLWHGFLNSRHASIFWSCSYIISSSSRRAEMRCQSHLDISMSFCNQSRLRMLTDYVGRMPFESSQLIWTNVFQCSCAMLRSDHFFEMVWRPERASSMGWFLRIDPGGKPLKEGCCPLYTVCCLLICDL